MSDQPIGANPYVGPRPFRQGEALFGRDKEVPDLFYLLNAERVVLLHSPSGAGKSSLVQAGLLPRLKKEEFDIWPTIRVSTESPVNGGANRYLLSTILSLEEELPETLRRRPETLSALSLDEYVTTRPRRKGASQSVVLLFDQFEEILTVDPLAMDAKREFFIQLGALLQRREIWALFAIREDYLAPLDPYARLVPTQFANRFRIDLLGLNAAIEAIKQPARAAGREFAPDVAERLVQDLAAMSVQRPDGSFVKENGHSVEPVQLQVVCRRLWDAMPAADRIVDPVDMERFGDVSQALGAYYDFSVGQVAAGDKRCQRAIRKWFSDKLITRGDIRGQVLQGAEKTEGLDNNLIYALLDTHLIRAEKRRGATWYELAHDRLIDPVSRSNNRWFETNLEEFQRRASAWESTGHPEGLLLTGPDLVKAESWVGQHGADLLDVENRYLSESRREQQEVDAKLSQAKRIRRLAIISAVVGVIAVLIAIFAGVAWKRLGSTYDDLKAATDRERKAAESRAVSERNEANAILTATGAKREQAVAVHMALQQRRARDDIFLDLLTKVIRFPITVDKNAVPGEVKGLEGTWVTLVAASDREKTPFAIARSFAEDGGGRVIAVGHDAFLIYRDQNADNQVLGTALLWLRGDRERRVLLSSGARQVLRPAQLTDLENKIRGWQFEVEQTEDLSDRAKLQRAGVIIIGNQFGGFTTQELDAMFQFVKDGGGLLAVGLGWSWKQFRPGAPIQPMDQYPMNQLASHFGATFSEKPIFQ